MPSENQNQAGESEYSNVYERAFAGLMSPMPLIRGINDYETALKAHRAAHKFDAREKHKRLIAEKITEYRDD